jgi:Protein of unknown function with PCYCGC motif
MIMRLACRSSFILFFVALSASLIAESRLPALHETQSVHPGGAFHDHPPVGITLTTLDPQQFKDNPSAFVAYTLASRIRETLYQVPCYCGCDKETGHASLLDCFSTRHSVHCHMCQRESIFSYLQRQKGKTPMQIREAMSKGKADKLNLDKVTKRLYSRLQNSQSSP